MGFLLGALNRRMYRILGVSGCAVSIVLFLTLSSKRPYGATTVLQVRFADLYQISQPEYRSGHMITNREVFREMMSEVEILKGESLAEKVVDRIGAERFTNQTEWGFESRHVPLPWIKPAGFPTIFRRLSRGGQTGLPVSDPVLLERRRAVRSLVESMDVRIDEHIRTISITFTSFDPDLVSRVLPVLTDLYLSDAADAGKSLSRVGDRLVLRADSLFERLAVIEAEIEAAGIHTRSDQKSRFALIREYESLQYRIELNRAALIAARTRIGGLENRRSGPGNPKASDLSSSGSPSSKQTQLELITEHLKHASALAESVTLARRSQQLSASIRERAGDEERGFRLQHEHALVKAQYEQLTDGLARVHYNALLESALVPRITVASYAGHPRRIPPNRVRVAAWSAVAGLAAALGYYSIAKAGDRLRRRRVKRIDYHRFPILLMEQAHTIPAGRIAHSNETASTSRRNPVAFIADPDSRRPKGIASLPSTASTRSG